MVVNGCVARRPYPDAIQPRVLAVISTVSSPDRRAAASDRPDPLELWRVADRAARHAEVRVANQARAGGRPTATAEAVLLRQKANELLRAALGELQHAAESTQV